MGPFRNVIQMFIYLRFYIEIAKIPQICFTQSSSAHWGDFFSKEVLLSLLYESPSIVFENLDLRIWKLCKEL